MKVRFKGLAKTIQMACRPATSRFHGHHTQTVYSSHWLVELTKVSIRLSIIWRRHTYSHMSWLPVPAGWSTKIVSRVYFGSPVDELRLA